MLICKKISTYLMLDVVTQKVTVFLSHHTPCPHSHFIYYYPIIAYTSFNSEIALSLY